MTPKDSGALKIISGGQTGIDRQALDLAIAFDLPHGGWCPRGRFAEDGRIPARYKLRETESTKYHIRTERNIIDSDGTLILHCGPLTGGTALTARLARKHDRPLLCLDFEPMTDATTDEMSEQFVQITHAWIQREKIFALNIAGPRLSSAPELPRNVLPFLQHLFATVCV